MSQLGSPFSVAHAVAEVIRDDGDDEAVNNNDTLRLRWVGGHHDSGWDLGRQLPNPAIVGHELGLSPRARLKNEEFLV